MNNILSYNDYLNMVRMCENSIISQPSKDYEIINEGFFDKMRKKMSERMVNKVLADEIEQGKKFEETIKETISELKDAYKKLDASGKSRGSEFTKSVEKLFSDIDNMHFDVMSLLTNTDIDFSGFISSAVFANVINFAVIFTPIRNAWMLKKAYNYFLLLIKQAIHKDLVMIQIEFDQFQNLVLKNAEEIKTDAVNNSERADFFERGIKACEDIFVKIIAGKKGVTKAQADVLLKLRQEKVKEIERARGENPILDVLNRYGDNTYKSTAESLKSLINDDSNKKLEAMKTSISKIAHGNDNLTLYGELLISTAEECALGTITAIHTNFLKMIEVFKLSNQKRLVELIENAEKEDQKRISNDKREHSMKEHEEEVEKMIAAGKKSYESTFKTSHDIKKMTVEDWYGLEDEERESIESYLSSSEGMKKYDEIKKENPMLSCSINNPKSDIFDIIEDLSLINLYSKDKEKGIVINDKSDAEIVYNTLRKFKSEYFTFEKKGDAGKENTDKDLKKNKNKEYLVKIISNMIGKKFVGIPSILGRFEKEIQMREKDKKYYDAVENSNPRLKLEESEYENAKSFFNTIKKYIENDGNINEKESE